MICTTLHNIILTSIFMLNATYFNVIGCILDKRVKCTHLVSPYQGLMEKEYANIASN